MDHGTLKREVDARTWYHKIELAEGVVTPGRDFDRIWNMIRRARRAIDYDGKVVLDIGSFDGMWAFEAEQLGARTVVATDIRYRTFENFLFCRQVLGSRVVPFYNVSPYKLYDRLDVFLQEDFRVFLQEDFLDDEDPQDRMFDVVQHLGVLYHLRDPLLSLSQTRSVMRRGGLLLLETAAVDRPGSLMLFDGVPPDDGRVYPGAWWAPTVDCLKEMLRASLFEPIEETVEVLDGRLVSTGKAALKAGRSLRFPVTRVVMVAKAVGPESLPGEYVAELTRTYRNPGLVVDQL